jgi:hypothetical protein
MRPGKYGTQTINHLMGEGSRPAVECTRIVRETRLSAGLPSSARITERVVRVCATINIGFWDEKKLQ